MFFLVGNEQYREYTNVESFFFVNTKPSGFLYGFRIYGFAVSMGQSNEIASGISIYRIAYFNL